MWGNKGVHATVIMSSVVMIGACMAYYVLLNSAFYSVIDGLAIWIGGEELASNPESWGAFSSRFTPFVLIGVIYPLSIMKEK
jgi:hypothetical protein